MRNLIFPRVLSMLVLALVCIAVDTNAFDPGYMNYQGKLTDVGGNPVADGSYDVTFRIYRADSEKWTESHSVTTTDGFFSVTLGSNGSPIQDWVLAYDTLWLGITVGIDPEITPRTRLTSVPHAYRVATVDGASGGYIVGYVTIGDPIGHGGITISPYDNGGGRISILGSGEDAYFSLDGPYYGTNETRVSIGNNRYIIFNTDYSGDSSVQFPDDAIHSAEILDEPGLASEVNSTFVTLSPGLVDIETVSITIPSDGYILVQGVCYVQTTGATTDNHIRCQIDENEGGSVTAPYFTQAGQWVYHSTNAYSYSISTHRIYFKTAGTYTFRLEGEATSTAHTTKAHNATVTVLFIPTGYDVVKSYLSDPTGFENAISVEVAVDGNPELSETMYEVDLRELEMKALKARTEALQAERDLYEAQLQRGK